CVRRWWPVIACHHLYDSLEGRQKSHAGLQSWGAPSWHQSWFVFRSGSKPLPGYGVSRYGPLGKSPRGVHAGLSALATPAATVSHDEQKNGVIGHWRVPRSVPVTKRSRLHFLPKVNSNALVPFRTS